MKKKFLKANATILATIILACNSIMPIHATETTETATETTSTADTTNETTTEDTTDTTTMTTEDTTDTTEITKETREKVVVIPLMSESAVLIDGNSGKVLFELNKDARSYPASTTKILTSLVLLDYFKAGEYVVAGYEVNEAPADSSRAGIVYNEAISTENLVRGLMLPSGNDVASVVCVNVAKRASGRSDMTYDESVTFFVDLMNKKAKELGATNSNFMSPDGYHDVNHYTTASDMALIAKAALSNDIIREVVAEKSYVGKSAELEESSSYKVVEHSWVNRNELVSSVDNGYQYATGVKTGFTEAAGETLVASAVNDDEYVIAVLFKEPKNARWDDAKMLFEYAFKNFDNLLLASKNDPMGDFYIDNPPLGQSDTIGLLVRKDIYSYMKEDEESSIVYEVTIDPDKASKELAENGKPMIKTPIKKGEEVGEVTYFVSGQEVATEKLLASRDVGVRTFKSDVKYVLKKAKDFIFSWKVIPPLIAIGIISFAIYGTVSTVNANRRYKRRYDNKKNRNQRSQVRDDYKRPNKKRK